MRDDLSRIVASLINTICATNISTGSPYSTRDNRDIMKEQANKVAEGLEYLNNEWPGHKNTQLESDDKRELDVVVKTNSKNILINFAKV